MELSGYVDALRAQLAVAAAAGGDEAIELAERLTSPLEAAARLVLQDALSDAALEITRELAPGSVELRLRGRELSFVVSLPPAGEEGRPSPHREVASAPEPAGDGVTSRISFRPPDHLKARIEEAAEREGLSVNSFLVRTLAAVLDPNAARPAAADRSGANRVTGWFS